MNGQDLANYALFPIGLVLGIFAWRAGRVRPAIAWRGREAGLGLLIGTVAIVAIFAIEVAAGLARVTGASGAVGEILVLLVYLAILGTVEELIFRGLLLAGLLELTGRAWLATGITALLVALPYTLAEGANPLTFLSAFLAGVMYGVAYLRTGRIWLSVGLRTAWNFVQGPVLGFTVSGTSIGSDSILQLDTDGPTWLAGGAYGPEGGLIAIAVRLAVIAFLVVAVRRSLPSP
ncbi:CPBP family intramembrane glutamic endopeptidase [Kribbella sp. DT2]|uniref:CPBP family intramembrane glutamic endopeptidase n=1 Tax=Kribbella sp. DT2 TaxID=3393427 RepID=UPI003CF97505